MTHSEDITETIEIPVSLRREWPTYATGRRLSPMAILLNYAVHEMPETAELRAGRRIHAAMMHRLEQTDTIDFIAADHAALALQHVAASLLTDAMLTSAESEWKDQDREERAESHSDIQCPAAQVSGLKFSEAWELMQKGLGAQVRMGGVWSPLITLGKKDGTLYALDPVEKVWVELATPERAMDEAGFILIGAKRVVFEQILGQRLPEAAFPQDLEVI